MIPFSDYCTRVEATLAQHYRIPVVTREITAPLIGDLDGAEIHIDPLVAPEARLFLLTHLFGHTVQWNVDPRAFDLGRPLPPPVDCDLLPEIVAYEHEAAAYALSLIHEAGITSIDQWFSDYSACDEAYLLHYYRTGERKEFATFWRTGSPLFPPKAIPVFSPARRAFRRDGVVI